MRTRVCLALLAGLVSTFLAAAPTRATPSDSRYIVVLDGSTTLSRVVGEVTDLVGSGSVLDTYGNVNGLLVRAPSSLVVGLLSLTGVVHVERDGVMRLAATQDGPPWGLDRIDQRDRPLSGTYEYDATGAGVTAYVIDTGIHATHDDFTGRVVAGTNTVDPSVPSTTDCNGHGTHVAGTIGGETYGVAKDVTLVAVRVFECGNSTAVSEIIEGVDWVTGNHSAGVPAVANMSLGGSASAALDSAVNAMIADGVSTSVASGNESKNACDNSPGRVPAALTAGATDINDARASFSNFGTCVDVHAPGVGVESASPASDSATATLSGTSMATPHVTGASALFLQQNPGASPATVHSGLVGDASTGKISGIATSCNFIDSLLGTCTAGTPNRLLYTGSEAQPPPPPPPPPACNAIQRLLGLC